ncbi:hypothetical protein [Nocardia sputi]|uniref:hypothetical protein n=1 Tax=Nocardia sputi TaxID=2943705 RepID=UPI0020C084ED|nr:hypothetical protein [Nocardia sputi]
MHSTELRISEAELTAYHEAGHAIAYLIRGIEFTTVTIAESGGNVGDGHIVINPPRLIPIQTNRVIAVAGPLAEAEYLCRGHGYDALEAWHRVITTGCSRDDYAQSQGIESIAEARKMVNEQWGRIVNTAIGLQHLGSLSCAQVCELANITLR